MSSVDVVVPCYKYGHFLRDCVSSVLSQEGVEVRVLIIDDCSPDNTPEVGRQLAEEDRRVEYRRHEKNKGHIATYNEGLLGWASAEYSLLLSADDVLTQGSFARAAAFLDVHPEAGFVYGKRILWEGDGAPPRGYPSNESGEAKLFEGQAFLEMLCNERFNPVCTPTAVVRTKIQKAVGGYRPNLPHTGDLEMWLRFGVHGAVGVLQSDQAFWRAHATNMREAYTAKNKSCRGLADIEQHAAAFDSVFQEHARRIANLEELRKKVMSRFGQMAMDAAYHHFEDGDTDLSRNAMDLAVRLDPAIRSGGPWFRMRCKLAMGHRFGGWVAALRRGVRIPVATGAGRPKKSGLTSDWRA